MNFGLGDRSRSLKKIEIASLIGLPDVFNKELAVAAGINMRARTPSLAPSGKLLVADMHVELLASNIELYHIAFVQ